MQKSTKIFIISIFVLFVLAYLFKDVKIAEYYVDYAGCSPEEIEIGCHGDATRLNLIGLVTPISVILIVLSSIGFGGLKVIRRVNKT